MLKIYRCKVCGNIVIKIKDSGMDMTCCGKPMTELKPGMTDGSVEKHVPTYKCHENMVDVFVGEEAHPMTDIHHVEFIIAETSCGFHLNYLEECDDEHCHYNVDSKKGCYDGCMPETSFSLRDMEELRSIYEYCNLHGLYKEDC